MNEFINKILNQTPFLNLIPLILIILALIAGVVSSWTKLFPPPCKETDEQKIKEEKEKIRKERFFATLALILLVLGLTLSGLKTYADYLKIQEAESYAGHIKQAFNQVPEASGGVAVGEYVYLVDDDRAKLFQAKYNNDTKTYDSNNVKMIDLVDESSGEEFKKSKHISDLEAAAYYTDRKTNTSRIYLLTSHSDKKDPEDDKEENNKKEESKKNKIPTADKANKNKDPEKKPKNTKRQRFLEVELKPGIKDDKGETKTIGVVTRWANLRKEFEKKILTGTGTPGFSDYPEYYSTVKTDVIMQAEGLAIDEEGNVYFGFRGPVEKSTENAFILKTSLDKIFSGVSDDWKPNLKKSEESKESSPHFDLFTVDIKNGGNKRGIVDMLYHKGHLLILTNSVEKVERRDSGEIVLSSPDLWKLPLKDLEKSDLEKSDSVIPARIIVSNFYISNSNIPAKPEVLLLREIAPEKIFLFLDSQSFGGGQRNYDFVWENK